MPQREPFRSEEIIFTCWLNLATNQWQWMANGELHGPTHASEKDARAWFDAHGGVRLVAAERASRISPFVKDLLASRR